MACNTELKINELKNDIKNLKVQLKIKENLLTEMQNSRVNKIDCPYTTLLSTEEISRYSRQMLVPQVGLKGQMSLQQSSVLIVGIGGLGCPASLYLAAAGVGTITLLDYDEVEISNLHRQILHSEESIGVSKVESACKILRSINSKIKIIPLHMSGDSSSLKHLFDTNKYDAVLDGSDNIATRYLLNDICVLNKVPLISGSALQLEGQLTVYNYKDGPCYRCLFPKPSPPNTVTNCGDAGVLGVVPGVIGVLQALETIKVLTQMNDVLSGCLLVFDASTTTFMNVKLRNKKDNCNICGLKPTITELIDYEEFCGSKAHDKVNDIDILPEAEHISMKEFTSLEKSFIILDVRPRIEFEFCKLQNTINLPYNYITNNKNLEEVMKILNAYESKSSTIYFICRRGNDSQRAIKYLKDVWPKKTVSLVNVRGGLHAYSKYIDSSFPVY